MDVQKAVALRSSSSDPTYTDRAADVRVVGDGAAGIYDAQ
jgi:hypothetical protein